MKRKLFALTLLGGATLFAAPALANRHVYIGPAYDPGFYAPDYFLFPMRSFLRRVWFTWHRQSSTFRRPLLSTFRRPLLSTSRVRR